MIQINGIPLKNENLNFSIQLPAYIWSEEYQRDLFSRHFKAFDILRSYGWFIGEFIWNFADFNTAQSISRKKIIFKKQFTY